MRRVIFFIIIAIIFLAVLTGCWSARELEQLGVSLIMGIDVEDERILLTVEVVDPIHMQKSGSETDSGNSVKYVQGRGNNIFEAFRDITLKFDRRIFVSHNKVIIFGDEFARRGIVRHIDELFRDNEQRESAHILVAKGKKAYEVMGINNGLENMPADYILSLIKNFKLNPKAVDVNMIEYLRHYYHKGHNPYTGIIEKKKKRRIDNTGQGSENHDYELSVMGLAVFNEDILVGYLNGNNTKSLNFVANNIKGGIINFPTPVALVNKGTEAKKLHYNLSSIIVIKNKTKNDIEIRDGEVILKTKIKLRGAIGEVMGDIDISKEKNIKQMEKACSKVIEKNIRNTVKKVQREFGTDIFGYALVFHSKYPDEWRKVKKDWNEIFSKARLEVEADTHIIRTGLINIPIIRKKGE